MIALASDHGGYELKEAVKAELIAQGYECKDFGTYSTESCHYPEFAAAAARSVASGECEKGIVICTTGIGVSIVANKIRGIRCALCGDVLTAEMTAGTTTPTCWPWAPVLLAKTSHLRSSPSG